MQSKQDQNLNKDQNKNLNKDLQEQAGSNLDAEDKEQRKMDDYKAHTHEKQRNLNAEYRQGELHGVVGKEIHDLVEKDKQQSTQQDKNLHHDRQQHKAQSQDTNKNQ